MTALNHCAASASKQEGVSEEKCDFTTPFDFIILSAVDFKYTQFIARAMYLLKTTARSVDPCLQQLFSFPLWMVKPNPSFLHLCGARVAPEF